MAGTPGPEDGVPPPPKKRGGGRPKKVKDADGEGTPSSAAKGKGRAAAAAAARDDEGAGSSNAGPSQMQQQQQQQMADADARGTKRGADAVAVPPAPKEKKDRQRLNKKNLFAKELPTMMYAFGDDPDPLPESVAVLEEIMVDYLTDLCRAAAIHSPNAKKLRLDDLRFALRKPQQSRQLARVEELLYLQEDIARARKNLDIPYGKNAEML